MILLFLVILMSSQDNIISLNLERKVEIQAGNPAEVEAIQRRIHTLNNQLVDQALTRLENLENSL